MTCSAIRPEPTAIHTHAPLNETVGTTAAFEEALTLFAPYLKPGENLIAAMRGNWYVPYLWMLLLGPFFVILWRPYMVAVTNQSLIICRKTFFGQPTHIDHIPFILLESITCRQCSRLLFMLTIKRSSKHRLKLAIYKTKCIFRTEQVLSQLPPHLKQSLGGSSA